MSTLVDVFCVEVFFSSLVTRLLKKARFQKIGLHFANN